jgi:hypothetical protein
MNARQLSSEIGHILLPVDVPPGQRRSAASQDAGCRDADRQDRGDDNDN